MLAMSLCDLFHIPSKIYLSTVDGEILMPNIKIVELILLNPKKYKQISILSEKENFAVPANLNNAYGSGNPMKSYDEGSTNQSKFNDSDYKSKGTNHFSIYEQPKKFEKNDIEKEYLMYKEAKKTNTSLDNVNRSANMTNDQIISQNKSDQYKNFSDKDFQRPYTPLDSNKYNSNVNNREQSSNYPQNYNLNNPNLKDNSDVNEIKPNEVNYNYNSNDVYGYDKSKSNLNSDFRLPLHLDNIQKEQYRSYNVNNVSGLQQNKFKEDSRKFASEKRSFRSSEPNANGII